MKIWELKIVAAQIKPSAPEMPGVSVGDGAGLPFHICPGFGMLCASTAVSSVIMVSEKGRSNPPDMQIASASVGVGAGRETNIKLI